MAHYAKILDGVVVDVIVADESFFTYFIDTSPGEWIKTSYNTKGGKHYDSSTGVLSDTQEKALRKNFAGVGMIYDKDRDAFYNPQPFPSWNLNEDTCLWEPPVECPVDENIYNWNEETKSWDLVDLE